MYENQAKRFFCTLVIACLASVARLPHALVEGGTSDFAPTNFRQRSALGAIPGLAPAGP